MLMVYQCLSSCSLLKTPMFTAMLPGYRLCCYSLPPATVPRRCSWSFITNLAWSHALPRAAAGEPWLHFFVTSRCDLTGVLREESPNGFISGGPMAQDLHVVGLIHPGVYKHWAVQSFADAMDLTAWVDLIIDKEIQSASGANIQKTVLGRPNILVGDVTCSRGRIFSATEFVPPGCAGAAILNDFLQWDEFKPLQSVQLLWNIQGMKPKNHDFLWCMNARASNFGDAFDYEIDHETTVIPIRNTADDHVHMLSLFGGGFGGWTYGMKHLCAYHGISAQIVAVESDLIACANYAANHDVPIVNGYATLPSNLMQQMPKGCVIHGNVLSTTWIEPIAEWHPQILTISAPCQPWSGAGHAKGLLSAEGLSFPEALLQARLLQPEVIGLEQVTGFNTHEQRSHVIKVISMIGYAINWSRSFDFAVCGPVTRSRWIALLHRISDIPPIDRCPPSLSSMHARHDHDEQFDQHDSMVSFGGEDFSVDKIFSGSDRHAKSSHEFGFDKKPTEHKHDLSSSARVSGAEPDMHPTRSEAYASDEHPASDRQTCHHDPAGRVSENQYWSSPTQVHVPQPFLQPSNQETTHSFNHLCNMPRRINPSQNFQPVSMQPDHAMSENLLPRKTRDPKDTFLDTALHSQTHPTCTDDSIATVHSPSVQQAYVPSHVCPVMSQRSVSDITNAQVPQPFVQPCPTSKFANPSHMPDHATESQHMIMSDLPNHVSKAVSKEHLRYHHDSQNTHDGNSIGDPSQENDIKPRIDISPNVIGKDFTPGDTLFNQISDSDTDKECQPKANCHSQVPPPEHAVIAIAEVAAEPKSGPGISFVRPDINIKKRPFSPQQLIEHLKLPQDDILDHTPKSFQALLPFAKIADPQLKISDDMKKIVQDQNFLPAAKRRKLGDKTPMQMRTYSQDQKLPVIMAACIR